MRIGIIGAGMAGLSCATALQEHGQDVVLFDKGRGPGGRMSTRRLDTPMGEAAFDHGAQYMTARDPGFQEQIERWAQAEHAARWPAAGPDAWVGTPAMNAPIRAMAEALDVRWNARIDALVQDDRWHLQGEEREGPFDAVIVAVPAEQVAPLIAPYYAATAALAQSTQSDPCWTVMAAYDTRLPVDSDRLTDLGWIASAVRNSAKPGRTGPEAWVLQADADWSREHLEDEPGRVKDAVIAQFAAATGATLPAPIASSVHRWRYAKSGASGRGAVWRADLRIGVCGDWLLGARIEAAWLSGRHLARQIG